MEVRHAYVFTALQILAVGVLVWVLVTWNTPWNAMRYIGTALAVVGVSLVGVARFQLGKSFAVKAEAHELVTRGLYSKFRNPIYVFGVVMLIGLILVVQKPFLWIVLVIMVIGQVIRARREARVLETAFGDAYREYRRKTWF
jgi:protein-S-isoprenylcysteine O-methyltransferase Ste14